MTQAQLHRAVARATGECVSTIVRRGFSIADPIHVRHDPEPSDRGYRPRIVNWDALDAQRVAFLPQRGR